MDYATKMLLVPNELVDKLNKKGLSELDKELMDILYSKEMNNSVKWKLYSQVLQRFLHHVEELKKPVEIPIQIKNAKLEYKKEEKKFDYKAKPPIAHPEPERLHDSEAEISDTASEDSNNQSQLHESHIQILERKLPKTMKKRGILLYEDIARNSNVTWDDNGIVTINGIIIAGTNIVDLVSNAVRSNKAAPPIGWLQFVTAVSRSNINKCLLGANATRNIDQGRKKSSTCGKTSKRKTTATSSLNRWSSFKFY